MKNIWNRRSFLQISLLTATGASLHGAARVSSARVAEELSETQVVWWVAADPHVGWGVDPEHYSHGRSGRNAAEDDPGQHLRKSIQDVNQLGIADYAVMLGDLVSDSKDLAAPSASVIALPSERKSKPRMMMPAVRIVKVPSMVTPP